MATSLENLSNMLEIGHHRTHYSINKFDGTVYMTEVMGNIVQLWLSNLKFGCHGDIN